MQKAFVAIIVALALSSAVAQTIGASGWAKTPVGVCENSNLNCSNRTSFSLGGLMNNDVNILSYNSPTVSNDTKNNSDASWDLWTKVVDTKTLTSTSNTSYTFKAPSRAGFTNGYAIGYDVANDTNGVRQVWLYQTKLVGASTLPRVALTTNKDVNYTPGVLPGSANLKTGTLFFFYAATATKINYTTFTVGGSAPGKEFTLTTSSFNSSTSSFSATWGEALGSSVAYAAWTEGDAFKVAAIDCSAGSVSGAADLGGYNKNYSCSPYSTDKKYYGVLCTNPNNGTTEVYVSANSTSLLKMFTIANSTTQKIRSNYAYAGYLAFFYSNPSTQNATVLSHDIWDVEKFVAFKNKTDYLTYDPSSVSLTTYRVPQGGIYGMLYTNRNMSDVNSTKTNIQAGLILSGSYLTTIFGSLVTIIAGLFLF